MRRKGRFRSRRSRQGGSGAQEGRFRSPNRTSHQSREQTGLFRSPRSRQGGSGAQEGWFRSPNRPNHQSREQMGLFRSPRSRPGGSDAQEGRFRSPNRTSHQSREQTGLFRSPRSRQGGSGAQEGWFRSPNRPNHQSREQMGLFRSPRSRPGALVRRKAGSAHQTERITSLVSKWGCSAHQGAGQVLWCAGRPVPLTKSNRCGHGRSAVGSEPLATGSWQRAAGNELGGEIVCEKAQRLKY